jgi:hypothetical protein
VVVKSGWELHPFRDFHDFNTVPFPRTGRLVTHGGLGMESDPVPISLLIFRQHLELPSDCKSLAWDSWNLGYMPYELPCLGSRQRLGKRRTIGTDDRNNDKYGIKARTFLATMSAGQSYPRQETIRHGC